MVWNSAEYQQELELRNRILRKPLGLNLFDENLENEKNDFHLGLLEDAQLRAILVLTPLSTGVIKMRQVAVDSDFQGQGYGAQLVIFSEDFSRKRNFQKIVLHARKGVVPFYLQLGYSAVGEEFVEVTIPHLKMEKIL